MESKKDTVAKNISKSYFVVSDTHLGSNKNGSNVPNYDEFCNFLKWIKNLPENGERIIVKKGESRYEKTILPPSKIILLGDILDLHDPENADRSNVLKQAAKPFALLQGIKCDKIYVVGNHDKDLYELADALKGSALHMDTSTFEVHKRHYPEKVDDGNKIGDLRYAFIHGHQYDKGQITEWVSKRFNIRFDPIDAIQDIANISLIKSVFREKIPTVLYGISSIFLIYMFLTYGGYPQSILDSFFKGFTSLSLLNIRSALGSLLIIVLLTFLFSFVIITPTVKLVTRFQGPIWDRFKPRDKEIKEVIEKGYYKKSSDKMNADVVVFGHTHIAGSYYLMSKKKLFINTGAWVEAEDERKLNTFAYIDDNCVEVLSWIGMKKEGIYTFEEVCSHSVETIHKNTGE